jgi:rhomboid protease GluP
MAASVPPTIYVLDYPLENLPREQFQVLAVEAARQLNWDIRQLSQAGIILHTQGSLPAPEVELKIRISDTTAHFQSRATGTEAVEESYIQEIIISLLRTMQQLTPTLTSAELAQKYAALKPDFVAPGKDELFAPPATRGQQMRNLLGAFKPTRGNYVTPVLVIINVLIFILMAIDGAHIMQPDSEILIKWGANFKPMTLDGQWWRLITSCFVHIGILHLLLNMYALTYIGAALEPFLGPARLLTAYLLTGIAASTTSLWWHDLSVSAGASGAIFGLFGVFFAMLTTNLIEKTQRNALLKSIGLFIVLNLAIGSQGSIDNSAHIGGLVSGVLIGYAYMPGLKKPRTKTWQYITMALLTVLVVGASFAVYKRLPNDLLKYDNTMTEVAALEQKAIDANSLPEQTHISEQMAAIKDKGIPAWKEGIALLEGASKLDLPKQFQERNTLLKKYFELRLKSYELIYKRLVANNNQYDTELSTTNLQIEELLKELKQGEAGK